MYYRITMNSAIIALASRMVTIGRGGPSVNGAQLMTYLFRPAVVLVLGLLVAACGGGGAIASRFVSGTASRTSEEFGQWKPRTLGAAVLTVGSAPVPESGRAPVTGYAVYLESPDGQAPERLGVTGVILVSLHAGSFRAGAMSFHVRAVNRIGEGPRLPSRRV